MAARGKTDNVSCSGNLGRMDGTACDLLIIFIRTNVVTLAENTRARRRGYGIVGLFTPKCYRGVEGGGVSAVKSKLC